MSYAEEKRKLDSYSADRSTVGITGSIKPSKVEALLHERCYDPNVQKYTRIRLKKILSLSTEYSFKFHSPITEKFFGAMHAIGGGTVAAAAFASQDPSAPGA